MKIIILIFTMFLLSVLVSSCDASSHTSYSPDSKNVITVSSPHELNTYKFNDFVTIVVQNNSDDEIAFLPENGIALLKKEGDQWEKIDNLTQNSLDRKIILSSYKQKESNSMVLSVIPNIQSKNSVIVRIGITGVDQSNNKMVEGYVDVTLSP